MIRIIFTALKWMSRFILAFSLVLCSIFILMQTNYGKDKLIDLANSFLKEKYGIRIETTGLAGTFPYDINVDSLSIHDQLGEWLTAQNITFRFSPFSLIKGRLFIRELWVDSMTLDRLPNLKKQDSLKSGRPFLWTTYMYHVGLERLYIRHLSLGKEILGEPSSFIIEAEVTEKEPGFRSLVSLNLKRTDGGMGTAFVHAEMKGAEPYLTIDAGIEEPEKGLIGAILGINTPLFLTLEGSGPIKDWRGKLFIKANELTEIDSEIRLHSIKGLNIDLDGKVLLDPSIIPRSLTDLFESETRFKIMAHMKGKSDLALDSATIESNSLSCVLKGSLDIRHMISEGSISVSLKDGSPLGGLVPTVNGGKLSAQIDFNCPVLLPAANVTLTITELSTDTIRSDEFRAKALVEFFPSGSSSAPILHVSGKGNISGLYIKSLSDSLLEKLITWDLDMEGYDNGNIKVKNLYVFTDVLSANVSGIVNKDMNRGSFEAVLRAESLERYSSLLNVNIPPGIVIDAKINTRISGPSLNSHISGKLDLSENADDFLMDVIGPEIEYVGDVELSNSRIINYDNINIISDKAELRCSGFYDLDGHEIHSLLNLESDNLAAFSSLLKIDIQGSARVDASIDGVMEMLNLGVEAKAENLVLNELQFHNVSASVALTGQPLRNEGQISVIIEQPGYSIKGDSGFKMDNQRLEFKNILFKGPGFNLNGNISADNEKSLAEGELHAECKDLSTIASFFGKEIRGKAVLNMSFVPGKEKNLIDLDITANDISGPLGKSDNILIHLSSTGDMHDPEIRASISLSGFSNKNIFFKSIYLTAMGKAGNMDFTATGTGQAGYDIDIESSGSLSLSSLEQSLTVNSLHGEYGVIPVDIALPFKVTRSKGGIELESLRLTVAGGAVDGSGTYSKESLNLTWNFNNLPVTFLRFAGITELEGVTSGIITLSGKLRQPQARLQIIMDNLRLKDPQYANLPPFSLTARAVFDSERLEADLSIDSMNSTPFELAFGLPLKFSLSPFSWSYPDNGELTGHLSGNIDLEDISSLAGIYDQLLKGKLTAGFNINGTIKSPVITGNARLENGSYENINTSTFIRDISADISADGNRFVVNQLNGTDGMGGKISGSGWLDITPSKRLPYNLSLELKNMTLVRSETASLTVGGRPVFSGTLNDHTLTGEFTVEKGEYMIPERLPAEITDLEVREINIIGEDQTQGQKKQDKKSPLRFDVSIEGARQVHLTGRGLSSEWKGDLIFEGTSVEPFIMGRLSLLRGSYNFLGKRFTLTNGLIELDGRYPVSPYIEVTGKAETSEATVIINVTGDIMKPEIILTSEPSMPSDEILSQLLFGRDVAQITPLQAIELGNAVNTMLGETSYDIIGSTRKLLGVDQLELKQTGESIEESTVSIGKYVGNDLYIEVERGLGAESGKASVTWEIAPNVTVETEIGENSPTGVGVNWKWDY